MLNDETCSAVFILWEGDGDSIEVACLRTGEHGEHEGEVEGSAAFTDEDLVIQMKAKVCWPIHAKVEQS